MARDLTVVIPPREGYNFYLAKNGPILDVSRDPVEDRDAINWDGAAYIPWGGEYFAFKGSLTHSDMFYIVQPIKFPFNTEFHDLFECHLAIAAGTITGITITRKDP
jgi:hypothetical protein